FSSSYTIIPATSPRVIYTLSLHDALPIYIHWASPPERAAGDGSSPAIRWFESLCCRRLAGLSGFWRDSPLAKLAGPFHRLKPEEDRKSTRLNSSHVEISYAVFCLKKKKTP